MNFTSTEAEFCSGQLFRVKDIVLAPYIIPHPGLGPVGRRVDCLTVLLCRSGTLECSTGTAAFVLGGGDSNSGKGEHEENSSDMAVFLPGTYLDIRPADGHAHLTVIEISRSLYERAGGARELFPVVAKIILSPAVRARTFRQVLDSIVAMLSGLPADCLESDGVTLLYTVKMLLARLRIHYENQSGPATGKGERLFNVFMTMLTDDAPPHGEVKYYAARIGVTPQHLNRIVRRFTGTSIKAMIDKRLLAVVCDELIFSTSSVKQIALAAGFADNSNFSRWFSRLSGCSPSQFRREKNIYR